MSNRRSQNRASAPGRDGVNHPQIGVLFEGKLRGPRQQARIASGFVHRAQKPAPFRLRMNLFVVSRRPDRTRGIVQHLGGHGAK
jgi:hypothetical protein